MKSLVLSLLTVFAISSIAATTAPVVTTAPVAAPGAQTANNKSPAPTKEHKKVLATPAVKAPVSATTK